MKKMMLFLIAPLLLVACSSSKSYVDQETFENHLSAIDENQFNFAEMKVESLEYLGGEYQGKKGGTTKTVKNTFAFQYYEKENHYICEPGASDFVIYLQDIKTVYDTNEAINQKSEKYTRKFKIEPLTIHYEKQQMGSYGMESGYSTLKADFIFNEYGYPTDIKINQKSESRFSDGKYLFRISSEFHLNISLQWRKA